MSGPADETIVHGGDLDAARARFPSAPEPWIDLSTGINPHAYPFAPPPAEAWQRLPQASAERAVLEAAAKRYGAADVGILVAATRQPGTHPDHSAADRGRGRRSARSDVRRARRRLGALRSPRARGLHAHRCRRGACCRRRQSEQPYRAHCCRRRSAKRGGGAGAARRPARRRRGVCRLRRAGRQSHSAIARGDRRAALLRQSLWSRRRALGICGGACRHCASDTRGAWAVGRVGTSALNRCQGARRYAVAGADPPSARSTIIGVSIRCSRHAGRRSKAARICSVSSRIRSARDIADALGRDGILVRRFAKHPQWLRFGIPNSSEAWHRLELSMRNSVSRGVA